MLAELKYLLRVCFRDILNKSSLVQNIDKFGLDLFLKLNNGGNPKYVEIRETLRRKFPIEVADLEYWINLPPYSPACKFIGNIDHVLKVNADTFILRGWLIGQENSKDFLSVTYKNKRFIIFAHKLLRLDVSTNFRSLRGAKFSGFVGLIEDTKIIEDNVTLGFAVETKEGRIIHGEFAPTKVSPIDINLEELKTLNLISK